MEGAVGEDLIMVHVVFTDQLPCHVGLFMCRPCWDHDTFVSEVNAEDWAPGKEVVPVASAMFQFLQHVARTGWGHFQLVFHVHGSTSSTPCAQFSSSETLTCATPAAPPSSGKALAEKLFSALSLHGVSFVAAWKRFAHVLRTRKCPPCRHTPATLLLCIAE